MRIKLDENLGTRLQEELRAAGHDVATVLAQKLSGAHDPRIYAVCRAEKRTIVTLDLDFANPLRFPVEGTAGIVILRTPENPSRTLLKHLVEHLIEAFATRSVEGKRWIVEPGGRIRERESIEP